MRLVYSTKGLPLSNGISSEDTSSCWFGHIVPEEINPGLRSEVMSFRRPLLQRERVKGDERSGKSFCPSNGVVHATLRFASKHRRDAFSVVQGK